MGKILDRVNAEAFRLLKALRQRLSHTKSENRRVVFVSGVHRSGTNMMMDVLDASWKTDVFHERDARAFDDYIMRETAVIRELVERSRATVIVVKALHEAHKLGELMDDFAPAKGIWVVRTFEDSVDSSLRHWPGWRNRIELIVGDRNAAEWRGLGMSDETHRIVRDHFRPDMSDASAIALFWYYRNQLFFDQKLDDDERVLIVRYEDLLAAPDIHVADLAAFLGLADTAAMRRVARASSRRVGARPELCPRVRELCEGMQKKLQQTRQRHFERVRASSPAD